MIFCSAVKLWLVNDVQLSTPEPLAIKTFANCNMPMRIRLFFAVEGRHRSGRFLAGSLAGLRSKIVRVI